MKSFILSKRLNNDITNVSKNDTRIDKFNLNFTRMNIDVNEMGSNIDRNDGKWIFTMMNLPIISIHNRFLDSSILDRTAIDVDFAVFIRSEGQGTITNDSINGEIGLIKTDWAKLLCSIFFENLDYSGLDIIGWGKIMDYFPIF